MNPSLALSCWRRALMLPGTPDVVHRGQAVDESALEVS
jgi:hypothetical protein